jgi:hypothetical protein
MWLRRLCASKRNSGRCIAARRSFLILDRQVRFGLELTARVHDKHRKSLKSEARGLLYCLQLFNLQIEYQALERRTQARARMLQEKQEKLDAQQRALLAAQEEVRGGA